MKVSAQQINEILKGEIVGNASVTVSKPAKIEHAKEGDIAFLANEKYKDFAYTTEASILITNKSYQFSKILKPTLILVDDAYQAFTTLLQWYDNNSKKSNKGVSNLASIADNAIIDSSSTIEAFVSIGENTKVGNNCHLYPHVMLSENVIVGNNTILHSGVKVYKDCTIGDNCIIHANTVIGSDGFGFAPNNEGIYTKVPQLGNVVIKDNVEIGSNTCIDRATLGSTIINEGVKLDNLIQIAHNVEIGKHTVIAAQTGVSGSTKIGDNNMIGGQVGIVGHIFLANKTKVQAQSGINKSINEEGTAVYGSPALPYQQFVKSYVIFKQLPELKRRIEELEKK